MTDLIPFHEETPAGPVQGRIAPEFAPVAWEFALNFEARGEVGASVCLEVHGRTVVDLWGGMAEAGRPWAEDTVCVVFSCTKAATAACAHILAARGALDLDAPAAEVWPEFAAEGKGGVTLRMMLDHTAGVPAIRAPLKPDCLTDWDYMTGHLAAEAPFWEPGARTGYHALTFGFTVGEMVRRAAGRSLGTFWREEAAGPLGLDFHIGLPETEEARVAPIIVFRPGPDDPQTPFMAAAKTRGTIANLFAFNHGDWAMRGVNTRAGRAAEIGAAGGVTNGRGLARFFSALGGGRLLDADRTAALADASSATHLDATLLAPTRFSAGFMLSMDNRRRTPGGDSLIMGRGAFGHVGAGGSVGFADPACGLGFGYAMNRMGPGLLLNPRGQSLVDAAYRCLGRRSDASGAWTA